MAKKFIKKLVKKKKPRPLDLNPETTIYLSQEKFEQLVHLVRMPPHPNVKLARRLRQIAVRI
jgi:hypothetical protein